MKRRHSPRFVMTQPSLHIRNQSSMLPPTSGILESVSKYLFESPSAENDDNSRDAREMMDELLDSSIAVGAMNSSHLENAKRAISLLADKEETTKQDIDKAWNLLDRLAEELKHPTSNITMMPPEEQTALLNGILTTWRKSVATRFYNNVQKRDAMEEINNLLSRFDRDSPFFQPNTESYNEVMRALNRFAKHGRSSQSTRARLGASELAEAVVKRMNKKAERNPSVKPDIYTYTSLINALKGNKSPDVYERAEAILDRMKREGLKPDTRSYNAVLGVLVKSMQNAGEKAENFLYRMQKERDSGNEEVEPDAASFAYVIEAWARQENSESAQRAEDIVEHMQKQHDEGVTDVWPGLTCYKWAILAWAKSGDPAALQKSEAILRRAQQRNIRSDPNLFTPIMGVCAQTADPNAAMKADALLQEMKSLGFKETKVNYICALKAWKRSKDPKAKTRIEMLTKEMEKEGVH